MSAIVDQVINKLDTLVANSITNKQLIKQQQEAQLMTSLLQMEIQNQQLYRAEMLDKNLTLDPKDQTNGYMQLASLTGDSTKTDSIAATLLNLQIKNAGMYQALQDYNKGSAVADSLLAEGYATSPGEEGVSKYMFSSEELDKAVEAGALTPEQAANPNLMEGLNISTKDAFDYMQFQTNARRAEAQMKHAEIELNEKELSIANVGYHSALGNAGNIMLNKMSFQIPPQLADKVADFNLTKFINLKNSVATTDEEKAAKMALTEQYDTIESLLQDPELFHPEVASSILKALNHYSMTEDISGVNNAHTQFAYLAPIIKKDFDDITAYEVNAIQSGIIAGTIDEKDGEIVEEELDFLVKNDDVYKDMKSRTDSWASLGLALDESILQGIISFQQNMEARIDDKQNELFTRAVGEDTFDYDIYNSYPGSYQYEQTKTEFEDKGDVDLLYQESFIPGTELVIDIPANENLISLANELEVQGTVDPVTARLQEIDTFLAANPVNRSPQTIEEGKEAATLRDQRRKLIEEQSDIQKTMAQELASVLENAGYVVHSGAWYGGEAAWMQKIREISGFTSPQDILQDINQDPDKYYNSGITKPRR